MVDLDEGNKRGNFRENRISQFRAIPFLSIVSHWYGTKKEKSRTRETIKSFTLIIVHLTQTLQVSAKYIT